MTTHPVLSRVVPDTEYLSPGWFEYRSKRITASKAAAILGLYVTDPELRAELTKYTSPLQVWSELTGRTEPEPMDNDFLAYGVRQEPVIRAWYNEERERAVYPVDGIVQHPEIPWLCCTPDGLDQEPGTQDYIAWEAKTVSVYARDQWADGVPERYRVQQHVQMMCCGTKRAVIAVEMAPHMLYREIAWDAALAKQLTAALKHFWKTYVEADEPPEAISAKHDGALVDAIYQPTGSTLEWADEWIALSAQYDQAEAEQKELKNLCDAIRLRVKQGMKGADEANLPDGSSWSLSKPNKKTGTRSLKRKPLTQKENV